MHSLEGLLEFAAVVERGTFSAAARYLDVSVSYVSRQIAALEVRLEVQLFARTTRQMQLTEPGRRLYETSHPLLIELLHAQETILETREALEGEIKISLAGKFAEEQLVPELTRFCTENPNIRLELDVSSRNVDLIAEGYHLAVRMGPLETTSALVATRLLSVPTIILATQDVLEKVRPIRSPSDLQAEWCLPLVNRDWHFFKDEQREDIKAMGRFRSNSGAAVMQAALDHLGIVNVPAYYQGDHLKTGRLLHVLPDWTSAQNSTFYIVFPTQRHMPLRVRKLIEDLKASMTRIGRDTIPSLLI